MVFKSQLSTDWLNRYGTEATIITYTDSGNRDKQGDVEWTENQTTVKALKGFGTSTRMPEMLDREIGESNPMAFEIVIKSEDAPDETKVTDKKPQVLIGKKRFKVFDQEDMRIGITRLICESMR